MPELKSTLTMSPNEESALSHLIAYMCHQHLDNGELERIFGVGSPKVDAIGRINAALNAAR